MQMQTTVAISDLPTYYKNKVTAQFVLQLFGCVLLYDWI